MLLYRRCPAALLLHGPLLLSPAVLRLAVDGDARTAHMRMQAGGHSCAAGAAGPSSAAQPMQPSHMMLHADAAGITHAPPGPQSLGAGAVLQGVPRMPSVGAGGLLAARLTHLELLHAPALDSLEGWLDALPALTCLRLRK